MIFVGAMVLLAVLFGPKYGAEDRPAFKDPNVKPRPMVSPMDVSKWKRRI